MGRLARRRVHSSASVVAIAAAAGCAQIAGIEETTGLVPLDRVSLEVDRISIGATITRTPQSLAASTATYLIPDDAEPDGFQRIPADLTDINLWSAPIEQGAPLLVFDLPDHPRPLVRMHDLGLRNVTVGFGQYEHPNPTPAPAGAMITVQATLPTAYAVGETFQFYSVGTWNNLALTVPALAGATTLGPETFAFESTALLAGRPHERITAADAVLVLRYVANELTGVMEAAPFDQSGDDLVSGTMSAVAADQMLDATIDPAGVATRYAPLRPAMGAPTMSWSLAAVPGIDHVAARGLALRSAAVAAIDPGALAVPFGNPFMSKGWRTMFSWATTATRSFTPPALALPVTLRAELVTRVEPTAGMTVELSAGLPELITLDGMPLSTDGLTIARPTRAVPVRFAAGGTNTLYQLQLYELVPNMAGTALEYSHVITATSATNEFLLPPELFVADKTYVIRAVTYGGSYPELATGDLTVRSLPVSIGYHDSGVFTVAP